MDLRVPQTLTATDHSTYGLVNKNDKVVERDYEGNFIEVFIDHANKRLKVLDYRARDWQIVASWLDQAAARNNLGKILFYIRRSGDHLLGQCGYILEGIIPGFFRGDDALCYSRFTDSERSKSPYYDQEEEMLNKIKEKNNQEATKELPPGFIISKISRGQAGELVNLYRQVFSSYPSPLFNPDYVRKVMQTHVTFFGAFAGDKLVSAASADMDLHNRNAEITDCATLPEYRGKGLLNNLIRTLEQELSTINIGTLYSLARAGSYGMNAALYRLGYDYRGRFINNCHIGGRFEDMNLWVKTV